MVMRRNWREGNGRGEKALRWELRMRRKGMKRNNTGKGRRLDDRSRES